MSPTPTPDTGWTVANFENGSDGRRLFVDGDRLWALGNDGATAAMWTSIDGSSWQPIGGLEGDEVNDLVQGDAGYVAVGCAYVSDVCGIPLAWHSRDGVSWKRMILPAAPHTAYAARVAYSFGRYVIAGDECVRHVGSVPGTILFAANRATAPPCFTHLVIWSSVDGQSWVASSSTGLESTYFPEQIFRTGDQLQIVAYSASGTKLWVSNDGRNWIPGPSVAGGALVRVLAGSDGFVGIGSDQQGLASWRSAEGLTWQKLDDLPEFAGLSLAAAAATGSGVIVFAQSATYATVAWTSTDGATWTQDPLPDPMSQMYVYDAARSTTI